VHANFEAIYIISLVVLSALMRPNDTTPDMSISITVLFGVVNLQKKNAEHIFLN
jgi:hypothetical protein